MEHVLLQECFRLESIFCVWRCSRDEKYSQVCSNYTHLSQGDPKCRFTTGKSTTTCLFVFRNFLFAQKTQVQKKNKNCKQFTFLLVWGWEIHMCFFQMLKPEWFNLRFPVPPWLPIQPRSGRSTGFQVAKSEAPPLELGPGDPKGLVGLVEDVYL